MNKKACCLYSFLILVLIAALIFCLPFVLGLIFTDSELMDTTALALEPRVIADIENGYFDFENLTMANLSEEQNAELELHLSGEKWEEDFVESILSDYATLYETVELAAQKPFFQDPKTANPAEGSYLDGIPTIYGIPLAVRINNLKALSLMKAGKETEAFAQAYYSVTLGSHIEESYVSLIFYDIGNTAKKSGIETLSLLANEARNINLLAAYAQKLEEVYPLEKNLNRTYIVEYHLMSSIFDLIEDDPSELDSFMDYKLNDIEELFYPLYKKIGWEFYYHPNETKNLYYEYMRDISILNDDAITIFLKDGKTYITKNAFGLAVLEGILPRLPSKDRWDEEINLIKQVQTEMLTR